MISAQISHIRKYLEDQVDDDDAMPVLIRDEDSCSDSDQIDSNMYAFTADLCFTMYKMLGLRRIYWSLHTVVN